MARRALHITAFAILLTSLPLLAIADPEDSYADLAARVVPAKLRQALKLLPCLTADTGPGEVKPLRVSLLEAREQLDVFSFAFPNRIRDAEPLASAEVLTTWGRVKAAIGELLRAIVDWINKHVIDTGVRGLVRRGEPQQQQQQQQLQAAADTAYHRHKGRDLWLDMRADLDEGYEVLGDFQDLDHSLVEYNQTDMEVKRAVCLDWQRRISRHSATDRYLEFVSTPLHSDELYTHKHSSKLFWGYNGVTPDTALTGLQNLALMMRSSQLAQLLAWYPNVTALQPDDLLQDPGHTTFHKFRKLIRSILAVLAEFPELLGPGRKEPHTRVAEVEGEARAAAAATTLAARRALSSYSSSSSSSSSLQLRRSGGGGSGSGSRNDGVAVRDPCDAGAALKALQRLFHDLGQTNDKVFAYQFYSSRGAEWAAEAEEAHQQAAEGWSDNLDFMASAQVDVMARCIAATLPRGEQPLPQRRRRHM
ncbi:hypothetical protein CHLRE_02g119950v5 [Chlamydomonas reinhardtii]|uniref:Uncharacterized protein n=1 Tax=Chlamydomonas reinhardtii TaxID=3055 RepID=A0A2K3E3J6_CHLRE|nr:uncharacterized protein CHLRE_02g119950v5 [Chlamydomonas reinhardtii]PNW87368.1 hypothetical protein CHLRE_02g119950v5 [Chlamydomonas reinhardtii]